MPKISKRHRVRMIATFPDRSCHNVDQAKALSAADAWLCTSIVHDLRNPLATICAGAEVLMAYDQTAAHVKRMANNIHVAASRMCELLTDLRHEACGTAAATEITSLRGVLASAAEAAYKTTGSVGIQIVLDVPGSITLPLVRTQMERVFLNLITNSLQAMRNGGKVRITAKESAACALIEVEDTGPGVPLRIRDRLFERFVTADKEDGLGLGLALARQAARDHGGDMWMEPASGARFVMRLPLGPNSLRS
jgi:signal transduction histidine kinase